jgi:hypothetical protein
MVVVVGGNVVVLIATASTTVTIPAVDNGIVVDDTAVVGRGVVPVVIPVVVTSTHAIIPTVTYIEIKFLLFIESLEHPLYYYFVF